ncbi:hypothetical protein DL768_011038 [Monosporascus sp. mg162]|nr:hypothetical protein DL768_011038 [Monosporascus sp. mg162]
MGLLVTLRKGQATGALVAPPTARAGPAAGDKKQHVASDEQEWEEISAWDQDKTSFDWLDGDCALNYGTTELLISDWPRVGPAAERASPVAELAELADQPNGEDTDSDLVLAPSDFGRSTSRHDLKPF